MTRTQTRPYLIPKLLTGACIASLLAGCTTVGPNFHEPKMPGRDSYAMAGDDTNDPGGFAARVGDKVVGDWWEVFQSPGLNELMKEAIAGSPTLESARAKLAQARDAEGAQGGLLMADATAGA